MSRRASTKNTISAGNKGRASVHSGYAAASKGKVSGIAGGSTMSKNPSFTVKSGSSASKGKGAAGKSSSAAGTSKSSVSTRSTSTNSAPSSSVMFSRIGFLVVVAILVIFGLVALYSASSIYSYNTTGDYSALFFKQTVFVAVGALAALIIALVPYHRFVLPLCALALAVCIPLLLLVLIEGDDALGARRWIDLGFTTLQPSEFAKIALMLVLAHLVERCRSRGYSRSLIALMIVACIVPIGLIVVEPDLGTTIIAVIGVLTVLWFGGVPKRIVGALAIGLVLLALLAILGSGFRQSRITSWLDPWSDPQGSGYQLLNSYYSFGGGGIFGVGLGLSKQKFNWLPQSENDFIFAIVGEELGLIGTLIVVALFLGLVVMALKVARNAPDALGAMIAGSCGVIIGVQAFLNMLCVVGALPITGKPLPFFSAGGSSIISTLILVGFVMSVSLQSSEANVYDFRREQFTVVHGGSRHGVSPVGSRSALTRLPNPAAIVGAMIPRQATSERPRKHGSEKIIPISRGEADKHTREKAELRRKRELPRQGHNRRRTEAPVSMSSLRRNRVRRSGGRSA